MVGKAGGKTANKNKVGDKNKTDSKVMGGKDNNGDKTADKKIVYRKNKKTAKKKSKQK